MQVRAALVSLMLLVPSAVLSGTTLSIVGDPTISVKRDASGGLPAHIDIPVVVSAGQSSEAINLQVVRAAKDSMSIDASRYSVCLAAPAEGRGLWTLRFDLSPAGPLESGQHELRVFAWTNGNGGGSVCNGKESNRPMTPPDASPCSDSGCPGFDISISIPEKPPPYDGPILTLIGSNRSKINFDQGGSAQPVSFTAVPSRGVDATKLQIKVIDIRRDGANATGSFKECLRLDVASDPRFVSLVLTPLSDLQVGTYSVDLRVWLAPDAIENNALCDRSGPLASAFDHTTCKAAATDREYLTCQSVKLTIDRVAGQIRAPSDIVLNVRTIPFIEWFSNGPLWINSSPIKIVETSHDAAVDLSNVNWSPSLAVAGSADPVGNVAFRSSDLPLDRPLPPGHMFNLTPEIRLGSSAGYGDFTTTLDLEPSLGSAAPISIPVSISVAAVPIASLFAIIAGILLGHMYRVRFESGLALDSALVEARHVLREIHDVQLQSGDLEMRTKLSQIARELHMAMHGVGASASTVATATDEAKNSLKEALTEFGEKQTHVRAQIESWRIASSKRTEEPPEIEEKLSLVRGTVSSLIRRIETGDVSSQSLHAELDSLPSKSADAIRSLNDWLDINGRLVRELASSWQSADLEIIGPVVDSVGIATTLLRDAESDGNPTHAVLDDVLTTFSKVLHGYSVVERLVITNRAESFVVGLDDLAGAHNLSATSLRDAFESLRKTTTSPAGMWDVSSFAMLSQSLIGEMRELFEALGNKSALTAQEMDLINTQGPVALAKSMLKAGRFHGISNDEEGLPELVLAQGKTRFFIHRPLVVYSGEKHIWEVRNTDGSLLGSDATVTWVIGTDQSLTGAVIELALAGHDEIEVAVSVETTSGTFSESTRVSPIGRADIPDIAGLLQRIRRRTLHRTISNGVLISLVGFAYAQTVAIGYPGLLAAFIWGLSADISTNRIQDIISRAGSVNSV